jgi:PIN domain nuclease of toxin-antitoxin system
MKYLLDIHIFLWWLLDAKKLSTKIKEHIDRVLVAQAISEEMILLSCDEMLKKYPIKVIS